MNNKKSITLPLGEKLRFEGGRLYLGDESDAPSVALVTLDGGKRPVDSLDLPVLQACYGLIRNGILDLASRGEAPGIMFSVTVGLDTFLGMIGYDGGDETAIKFAWDSIHAYREICGIDDSGTAFRLLSTNGIFCDGDGPDEFVVDLMSNCVNHIAAKAMDDDNGL